MKKPTIVYPSLEAANNAMPRCPRPKGGQLGHWWYIDTMRLAHSGQDYVPCICGTCDERMHLSADAEEYPAV